MNNDELIIKIPSLKDENVVMEYRKECLDYGIPKSVGFSLKKHDNYLSWYNETQEKLKKDDIQTTYLVFRKKDNVLVGLLTIRHSLNSPELKKYSGHIGYSVRPSERRKGYASQMLKMGLDICKKLKIKDVLLICGEDNIASQKCIVKNGGILTKRVPLDDGVIQLRFNISIK